MATRKKARNGSKQREVTEVEKEIGRRLKLMRLERGLSQMQLAGMLGLTFQQVQKYEKGTNRIAAGRLMEIARRLETTPHELMGWLDKKVITPLMDEDTFKLMKAFSRLADKYKTIVRNLINSLIGLEDE